MRSRRLTVPVVAAVAAAMLSPFVHAQTTRGNEVGAAASISGGYQFDSDLDGGGNVGYSSLILSGNLQRQTAPQLSVGLTLRYDYEWWRFSDPTAFGGEAPWDQLNALSLGVPLEYAYGSDLRFGVTPAFEWSYEIGASKNDVLNYGAILSATKILSPQLVLGAGVGVFRQIDETKVFPFLIVQWQIDDRWRLANPFRAGPAGGAGLELAYAIDDNWELAGGGTYRSYRFRLDDHGLAPGGVGEHRFFPLFARATRKFGPQTRLDLYAGMSAGGRVSVTDNNGNDLAREDYEAAPLIGLTFAHRF